ncbi:MAG: hypothetical protein DYG93_08670 [Leptolyngbya sp. PLA2]|nr:hypothetical protein [Leptolyngbya sp.]MCE7971718.1 hypothetical protein [Leptolyngbya sp. PL-A2]MCZ7634359.1 hypothetical protein [Phycisphaerales bacterium]MDL1904844.1 hypothetical protein [Synechococcales cyanobacterium CNB]GIK19673.1 MAG: hypothetical protein BroJett004_18370 [Planctomycetota bacterium]
MTNTLAGRIAGAIGLAAALTVIAAPDYCYFLERVQDGESSGCGSGASFCLNNTIVCDVGLTTRVDYGCGKKGPMSFPGVVRKCFKITNAITHPCDDDDEPAGADPVGCRTESGVCCYGTLTYDSNVPGDPYMSVASGARCCNVVVSE